MTLFFHLKLLAGEDKPLLVKWNALLVLKVKVFK